jgi:NADH dehydrogenase
MTLCVVTVFGGSGFVGRHLVQALARRGITVRVATRDLETALVTKTAGVVGQIVPMRCTPWDAASVAGLVAGVDAVINLTGILYEKGKNTFQRTHVKVAETIARACNQAAVKHLIHMSALGADANSESKYACSKAEGETTVRSAFPDAVILRPSIIFGPEDNFFNRFARMAVWVPALPLIGGGATKFQPVYVEDVAQAMMIVLENPVTRGQTYELAGPAVYTFRQLLEFMLAQTGQKRWLVELPFNIAAILGNILSIMPDPMLTADQVILLKRDNIIMSRNVPTLQSLGITPTAVEAIVPSYLSAYREGGRFALVEA